MHDVKEKQLFCGFCKKVTTHYEIIGDKWKCVSCGEYRTGDMITSDVVEVVLEMEKRGMFGGAIKKETDENYGKFPTDNGISPQRNLAITILETIESITGRNIPKKHWYACEDAVTEIIEKGLDTK